MRRAAALALALAPLAAAADSLQLTPQNDSGFATDRGYTSGVRLGYLWEGRVADAPRFELGLEQRIYTPDTRQDPHALLERPYAARLLAFGARHAAGEDRLDTLEAGMGVTGPSALGKEAQQLFHHLIESPPTDYSHQLHERFDAHLGATWSRTLARASSWPVSLAGHAGGVAGNVVSFAHAGIEGRWGGPDAPWSEPLRYVSTPAIDAGRVRGFSGFAGASLRRVLRNELLVRNAGDPGRVLEREDTVRRTAFGISYGHRWGVASLALVSETHEYTQQPYQMRFWSLTLAAPLD